MTASLVCLRRAQNRRRSENPCSSLHESNHNHIGKSYPPGACGAHIKREYDDMDRDATLGAVELFVRHGLEVQIPRLAGLYCEICISSYQNYDKCRQHTKPISTISTETTPSYTFSEKVGKTEASTHHHRAKQKPQPSKEPATAPTGQMLPIYHYKPSISRKYVCRNSTTTAIPYLLGQASIRSAKTERR